ncbi:60S ribosomal protein L14 [Orobanche minor]
MIQPQTYVNVTDNSGARELMCIRIIGVNNRQYANIGDIIVAVIKKAVPNMPLEKSEVVRGVVVRTYKELKRDNGIIIRYDDNAAVVIDHKKNPKGTRVFGAIPEELRQLNFTKIVSLASEFIMGRDTIAEIITSIRNADMDRKGVVRVVSTNITENIVKILLREGGIGIEAKPIMKKEQKWIYEGEITESLPNGMFRVRRLDNEDLVLGYISGKIRCNFIRISLGDKVKIEISRYDSTRGRIIYRFPDKDSKD